MKSQQIRGCSNLKHHKGRKKSKFIIGGTQKTYANCKLNFRIFLGGKQKNVKKIFGIGKATMTPKSKYE